MNDVQRISSALASWRTADALETAADRLDDLARSNEVVRDEVARLRTMAEEYLDDAMENMSPEEFEAVVKAVVAPFAPLIASRSGEQP